VTEPLRWNLPEPTDEELLAASDRILSNPDVAPEIVGATYGRTDYDNARRLALYEAANVRYVNDFDTWYMWCGNRWCKATQGDQFQIASRVALNIREREVLHLSDPDERDAHAVWGRHSLAEGKLRAMITVASGIDSIRIESTELDAQGHLFNAPNCTLNLSTAQQHAHSRDHLITQLCPTAFDPDAHSRRLDEFLERFMPDEKEREYTLQVIATSALSQGNASRKLILLLGPTSTGKSTLMELVMKTLGRDYVAAVNPSVFRGSLDDRPRPDIIRALKTRLILAFEASERWELHTDQIKRMTGGDAMTARSMRSDVMNEAIASFVPIIIANQPPSIRGSDDALRRRLLALIMDSAVAQDEDDGRLRSELVNDVEAQQALLAMFVRIYSECGGKVNLPIPPRFAEQTMELFASLDEVDEVLRWLKDDGSLYYGPDLPSSHFVSMSILFKCYSLWVDQNGTQQMKRDKLGPKQFTQRLQSLGYETVRNNGSRLVGWCLGETRLTNVARF
jgi:P4 family phage/plasmid primase-like protien